jgi:hypothetical protein
VTQNRIPAKLAGACFNGVARIAVTVYELPHETTAIAAAHRSTETKLRLV